MIPVLDKKTLRFAIKRVGTLIRDRKRKRIQMRLCYNCSQSAEYNALAHEARTLEWARDELKFWLSKAK